MLCIVECCNEQAVDELEMENKRLAEQYSQELKTLEQTADEKQKQLIETHCLTVQDLTNRHKQDLLVSKQHAEDTLAKLQQVEYHICFFFVETHIPLYFIFVSKYTLWVKKGDSVWQRYG